MCFTNHFDLEESLVAVIEKIPSLATVDSDDSEQQLTAEPEGHGRLTLIDDSMNASLDS